MASGIMEHLPNAYNPDHQGRTGSLRARMEAELAEVGKIVEMSGSMVETPDYGVVMDDVRITVRHPGIRVPVRLRVEWSGSDLVYRNWDEPGGGDRTIHSFINAPVKLRTNGYHASSRDDVEVTRDVFARWAQHSAWRYADTASPTYAQCREWDSAAQEWNGDTRTAFSSIFATEREHGLFLNRLIAVCHNTGLISGPKNFRMSSAGRKMTWEKGWFLSHPQLPDFTTERANIPENHSCSTPFVKFCANYRRLDGHVETLDDFFYDGKRIYSAWTKESQSDRNLSMYLV